MNRIWHDEHRLKPSATLDERVEWHLEHAKLCGCRDMPDSIKQILTERGVELPPRQPKA